MEGEMPKDPMMLMSFINMKLRDFIRRSMLYAMIWTWTAKNWKTRWPKPVWNIMRQPISFGNTQTQCNYRKRPLLAVIATEGTFIFFLCKSGVDYSSVSPSNPLSLSRMSTSILRR